MKILETIPKNINSVIQKGPKLLACVRYGFQDLYIFVFFLICFVFFCFFLLFIKIIAMRIYSVWESRKRSKLQSS